MLILQNKISNGVKKTGIILISLFFAFGVFRLAQAHTLATDGDITVLLHTNPDDDPIAGQSAAVLLEITDSKGKFVANDCDCSLTIAEGSQVLFAGQLLQVVGDAVYGFTEPFTFPHQAVYHLTVTGKPKTTGEFQNFQVGYDLRVDRGTGAVAPASTTKSVIYIIGSLLLVFAIIAGVVIYFIRKKRKV